MTPPSPPDQPPPDLSPGPADLSPGPAPPNLSPGPAPGFFTRLARAADAWLRAPAPATRLAALRILIGGGAVIYLIARAVHLVSFIDFPARSFDPVGVVALLSAPLPAWLVVGLVALAVPLGLAFTLGWRWRVTGPLFAVVLLWVLSYRNSWGMVFHTDNLMVFHVLVLGCVRAADAWSLDARAGRTTPAPEHHGWPVRLLALVTVVSYFIAGFAKLRLSGVTWIASDYLRNYVAWDNLRKLELGDWYSPLGAALVAHAWLFPPLALLSLFLELFAPLALCGPRHARVWAATAWAFHLGVFAVMAIFFPYPLLGVAFAPLFAVERLALFRWLGLSRGA